MIVKDENGRELEISVYGSFGDDIQIDDAHYLDDHDALVTDDTIEYIYETYPNELQDEWLDRQMARAERYSEGDR